MTRGKYAAKANGQRAEAAANSVVALRAQIEQMRRTHADEVAALRILVDQLNGKLVSDVRNLAEDRVREAETVAQNRVEEERAKWKERAVYALDFLDKMHVKMPSATWITLGSIFELTGSEALGSKASEMPRDVRRTSAADARKFTNATVVAIKSELLTRKFGDSL